MPTVFNASQKEAIAARNQNILVSAAAGSGKTTVMVEKIKETLIRHPEISISQFLVITFTKEAAHNMKDKLRSLLERAAMEGNDAASKALSEMETATISTIHSFCTQLLKEYNDNAGASTNPRVMKDWEKKHVLDECFTDAAEIVIGKGSAYSIEDRKAVGSLLTAFSLEEIGKMVQDLYNVLMGIPNPFDFLGRIVQNPPYDLWNREILNSIDLDVLGLEECLRQESDLLQDPLALPAYGDVCDADARLVASFLESFERADTEADKRALLVSTRDAFAGAPRAAKLDEAAKAWKKRMDELRNGMKGSKGIFDTALKKLDAIMGEKNRRLNGIIQRELRGLELLLRETAAEYKRWKLEAGAIDYADMEQTAYRIMSDPDKQKELLAKYKYIYVDECQDVSGIQDASIKSLTGPGHQFFMVGDIKQSIYGFRHAEPELFAHERSTFSDDAEAMERRIFFMDNYRSCKSVVNAVNEVFTEAMDARITDMDYIPEDNLRCNLPGDFGPVDVILVRKGDEQSLPPPGADEGGQPSNEPQSAASGGEEEDAQPLRNESADKLEAQSEAVGRYIRSLITPSPESSSRQHYQYKDIVILLRARSSANPIAEHLRKMHIPAMYEGVPDFFGLAEVKSFLSLLTVIDNLHNDDALAGTLINSPFSFTERDLADIRLEKLEHVPFYEAFELCVERNEKPIDRKCKAVADQLAGWRKKSESMPVPDFIWWLMRETGIYAARGAYPDGKARQANLDALYQRALDGEKAGNMRLSDFVWNLRNARETKLSDSDDHPAMGAGDNFVRIMTMHKSKGLEFPVVILMELQKDLRKKRTDEKLRMHVSSSGGALGLYLPAVQRNKNSKLDTQGRDAFDIQALRSNISEMTRLLYVAMTRAQQKLCLVGFVKDGEEDLWMNRTRAARIWKTRSMLDMIMPSVLRHLPMPESGETEEDDLWRLTCVSGKAIADEDTVESETDARIEDILRRDVPMRMYLPEKEESAPLKTSVTTLTRQARILSEDDSEETLEDKRKTEEAVRTFRLSSAPPRPAFLEEEKAEAVNIGTATHRFIRLIRLDALRAEGADVNQVIRGEMERMKASGIVTDDEAGLIRVSGVVSFFRSGLGQRMLQSPEIKREAEFTMKIDPHGSTMVQGIVDCAFKENGEWVLIDYKTDHDTNPETFVPRHEMQMNWYRTALERLTRTPVKEMWLFALRVGKAFPVNRIKVSSD